MARIGRIQVSCNYEDGSDPYVISYRVAEIETAGKLFVGISGEEYSQGGVTWYDDVNLSVQSDIDGMFNFGGTNTYTWLTPMTEVPDEEVSIEYPISIANGGTGATTAAQALTNLGAASVTALDALSVTVSGKADANHLHSNYATVASLDALSDEVDGKANASHTHNYAATNHTHSNYVTTNSFDALSDEVDGKADSNHSHSNYSLTTHNHDGVYAEASHTHNYAASSHGHSVATTAADGFMSAADKTKLSGIATGAEVNQNAFSNVVVGSTTIAADGKTDTLTLVAGSNVTLTPDATNDKVTIAATDTVYTHPTYTARTGVPTANQTPGFGGTFNVTQPVSDGSGHITAMNSRTVTIPSTAATTSAAGLMSAADKTKLDGIATGANAYTLPAAGSILGGVKTGGDVTISNGTITVNDDSHAHVISNIDGLQSALDGKAASSHTHTDNVNVQKASSPYVNLSVNNTSCATKIYKNASSTADYGTIIADFDSNGKKDSLNLRRSTSLANKLYLSVTNDDDTTKNYYLYGEHHKPTASEVGALPLSGGTMTGNLVMNGKDIYTGDIYINENGNSKGVIYGLAPNGTTYVRNIQPCNENGNCVIGWGNYDRGEGDTNIYGDNVHIYALNSDGTTPSGAVFVGRNSNNHTLINYAAFFDKNKTSDTYIYGSAAHVDTNNQDFTVDGIQLAHTDKATITSLSSGWAVYGSNTTPTVRRYGKVVSLTGAIKNTSEVTLNSTHVKVFTIPSGYRPSQDMVVVCQGSGANKYIAQITTDGSVNFGRYGTTAFNAVASGAWFPFHVSYVIE